MSPYSSPKSIKPLSELQQQEPGLVYIEWPQVLKSQIHCTAETENIQEIIEKQEIKIFPKVTWEPSLPVLLLDRPYLVLPLHCITRSMSR